MACACMLCAIRPAPEASADLVLYYAFARARQADSATPPPSLRLPTPDEQAVSRRIEALLVGGAR